MTRRIHYQCETAAWDYSRREPRPPTASDYRPATQSQPSSFILRQLL